MFIEGKTMGTHRGFLFQLLSEYMLLLYFNQQKMHFWMCVCDIYLFIFIVFFLI